MSDVTPLGCPNTPEAPPKHCHTTITNFNYEGSYMSGVICNIVVKADLGRWMPLGNREEMPGILAHQTWQMNLLLLMDPPSESSIDALNTTTPNLADEPTLADGPISHCYWHLVVKNGNFTLLLTSSGQEWQFHPATDIKWSKMAISHSYWHLVVIEWQFHIATDI